ncbi:MAG: acyl-CoA thioesterase [Bacteroidetes bacterium]|nr:acyl-CoA thioesterase [Bacteroidota bacterium]
MTTTTLPKELESQSVIRFPDCDPFNHLNNARYIDYIINAREDQLMSYYDFDVYKLAREQGLSWVVAQTQIAYLAPAELMEIVTIQTRLTGFTDKALMVEAVMWNEAKTQIKAVMWTRLVHYNLRTRSGHKHSDELTQFFESVVAPLPAPVSFEERVKSLR